MVRYLFDMREGDELVPDDEVKEFPNLRCKAARP